MPGGRSRPAGTPICQPREDKHELHSLGPSPPRPGGPGAGHGITGMRQRAAVFGGQVSAGPCPGGGWRVHTVLRLRPEAADGEAVTVTADGQSLATPQDQ